MLPLKIRMYGCNLLPIDASMNCALGIKGVSMYVLRASVSMGGDSPTAQQAACSGLRLTAKASRFELQSFFRRLGNRGHGNRGQIKIQED
jgi:hypothetical protein